MPRAPQAAPPGTQANAWIRRRDTVKIDSDENCVVNDIHTPEDRLALAAGNHLGIVLPKLGHDLWGWVSPRSTAVDPDTWAYGTLATSKVINAVDQGLHGEPVVIVRHQRRGGQAADENQGEKRMRTQEHRQPPNERRRSVLVFTNRRLPQQDGAASFRRLLGGNDYACSHRFGIAARRARGDARPATSESVL